MTIWLCHQGRRPFVKDKNNHRHLLKLYYVYKMFKIDNNHNWVITVKFTERPNNLQKKKLVKKNSN